MWSTRTAKPRISRPSVRILAVLAGLLMAACAAPAPPSSPEHPAFPLESLLPEDAIEALDEPAIWLPADAAQEYTPDERVIGVVIDGAARAYSLSLLSKHWIINDRLGERDIVVTWSPLTYTAAVFSRRVSGETLIFGESGKLLHDNLVMFDRETGSLWSQFLGRAIRGPHSGLELEVISSWLLTWAGWTELHPDSEAVRKGFYGELDLYARYYGSKEIGTGAPETLDPRLPPKALVFSVEVDGERVAIPVDTLSRARLVQLEIAGEPVLVTHSADSQGGAAFLRENDGVALHFKTGLLPGVMIDLETGSTWQMLSGLAIDGPLTGAQLRWLESTYSFWFHWAEWVPGGVLYDSP